MKKNKPAVTKGFSPFKENKSTHRTGDKRRTTAGNREKPAGKDFKHTGDKPARPFFKKEEDENSFRPRPQAGDERKSRRPAVKVRFPKKDDDSSFHGDFQPNDRKAKHAGRETPSGFNRQKFFDRANDRFADKQARKTAAKKFKRDNDSGDSKGRRTVETPGGEGMPLNKYIAHAGLCSRRKAVDIIKAGKVTVNDQQVLEPAFKVTAKDNVKVANKRITPQKNLVYILLNKPKGYITTTDDPEGRQTVMELIQNATAERVFPVGRLDRNTSGLLLLTNDGELAQKLAHPSYNIKKIYQVGLDKPLTKAHFEQILAGVTLEDGVALVDALGYVDSKDKSQVGIEIHSGKNRIVRRIFEHLEYKVEKLDRVMYAGLTKKNVNRGKWRFLSEKEIILLKHFK
jgi:23S rRNA pseudouridine2605 synthase